MNRRSLFVTAGLPVAAVLVMVSAARADQLTDAAQRTAEQDRLMIAATFPAPADIYLIGKGADQPALTKIRITNIMQIAGTMFLVGRGPEGNLVYINASQVLTIRVSKP